MNPDKERPETRDIVCLLKTIPDTWDIESHCGSPFRTQFP